jgi:hypothetical protein
MKTGMKTGENRGGTKTGDRRNVFRFSTASWSPPNGNRGERTGGRTERFPIFYSSKESGKLENVPSVPGFPRFPIPGFQTVDKAGAMSIQSVFGKLTYQDKLISMLRFRSRGRDRGRVAQVFDVWIGG